MTSNAAAVQAGTRIITGKLHRVRACRATKFIETPPPPLPEPVHHPARVAVMLALAHKVEDAIQRGVARDRADVARRLGLTRARVTQLLDLTLLASDIQAEVLQLEAVDGVEPLSERHLRRIAHLATWAAQREQWRARASAPPPANRQLPDNPA